MKLFESTRQARDHIWRQFAQNDNDVMVCIAECHFHTVEACVTIKKNRKIDDLELFLLKALHISRDTTAEGLNNLLHIGSQIIRQIAVVPIANGLIVENADGSFGITTRGSDTLRSGEMTISQRRRCHFNFISISSEFVRINDPRKKYLRDLEPQETGSNWNFDIETLRMCINESDQWKRERSFPSDVVELVTSPNTDLQSLPVADASNWVDKKCLAQKAQMLVVDKAQGTGCAIVIKFKDDNPFELKAYPFSSKYFLQSGEDNVLFSLSGTQSILKVLPDVDLMPSKEQLDIAWRALGEDYKLKNISRATVKIGKISAVVTLDGELISEWLTFCWQMVKGEVFCCIDLEKMTHLNKVSLEPADKEAKKQIDTMKLLCEIRQTEQMENVLCDISSLRQWLSAIELSVEPDIYELASLAWRLGEFGLAYRLAELEDMTDAKL
jgi:hypothetical protein